MYVNISSSFQGVINKVGQDYIGCLVHGRFNASIPRIQAADLPASCLVIGEQFVFDVVKIYSQNGVVSMRGAFRPDR